MNEFGASPAREEDRPPPRSWLVIAGYVTAILVWPVGLLIGIVLATQRNDHAYVVISIAVVVAVSLALSLWSMS